MYPFFHIMSKYYNWILRSSSCADYANYSIWFIYVVLHEFSCFILLLFIIVKEEIQISLQ